MQGRPGSEATARAVPLEPGQAHHGCWTNPAAFPSVSGAKPQRSARPASPVCTLVSKTVPSCSLPVYQQCTVSPFFGKLVLSPFFSTDLVYFGGPWDHGHRVRAAAGPRPGPHLPPGTHLVPGLLGLRRSLLGLLRLARLRRLHRRLRALRAPKALRGAAASGPQTAPHGPVQPQYSPTWPHTAPAPLPAPPACGRAACRPRSAAPCSPSWPRSSPAPAAGARPGTAKTRP